MKLTYVDLYFRVKYLRNGKEYITHSRATVITNGFFSEEIFEKVKEDLLPDIQKNGVDEDCIVKEIESCAKDEFELEDTEILEDSPIGYFTIYLGILLKENGQDKLGTCVANFDFSQFFGEEVWDMLAETAKKKYEAEGFENVTIIPLSKEKYEKIQSLKD